MWDKLDYDFGSIKSNQTYKLTYKYTGEPIDVTSIAPSCGACTDYKWNPETGELKIEYVPGAVPKHILAKNVYVYKANKYITVHYKNAEGTQLSQVLSFTAMVHN